MAILTSVAMFTADKLLDRLHDDWDFLLDSGAFTNFKKGKDVVTLDRYAALLREHGHRFYRYFNLDVIGNHPASMERLAELQSHGLDPVPVFQRGGTTSDLEDLLGEHRLVGIGGIAGMLQRTGDRDYLHQVMRSVGKRRDQIHLLGCGRVDVLDTYRPKSADASTYSAVGMYGRLSLWNGKRFISFDKTTATRGQPGRSTSMRPDGERTAILRRYDLTWSDLTDESQWVRREGGYGKVLMTSARSWIRYNIYLQRRGVTLFLVDNPQVTCEELAEAWEREKVLAA